MAAKSNLVNMVACLFGVCLVCGAVLAGVYVLTEEPIKAAAAAEAQAAIAKVLPSEPADAQISDALDRNGLEYYIQSAGGNVVAYAVKSTVSGFGGPLTLMVGVLPDGTVYNTSVLSHQETPGLGAKCSEEGSHFREQWKGYKGSFTVNKDGGDIDAITASTITSRAFTKAVKQAADLVAELGGAAPATDASSGASFGGASAASAAASAPEASSENKKEE